MAAMVVVVVVAVVMCEVSWRAWGDEEADDGAGKLFLRSRYLLFSALW